MRNSPSWPGGSTTCSNGSKPRWNTSGCSSTTRATSCARPSRSRGELELARLQTDAGADAETAAALDSALEEIDRLDHLAVSLLVLARTRSAGPPPQTLCDLVEISRRAVNTATAVADGTRTPPVVVGIAGHGRIRGDAPAIERAVRNLVENALRYARHRVQVTVTDDGEDAVVEVADDGPGFPPQWLEQGVGRFSAGDSPQAHGGAGLGLAIVDAIAGSHGGTVEIGVATDGEGAGGGARVRLHLPRAYPDRDVPR